jgi:alpha-beta hydrolase superfamily lysophospholipase
VNDKMLKFWRPFHSVLTLVLLLLTALLVAGCSALDQRQRAWIFQPGDRSWGSSAEAARNMDDVWIQFESHITGQTSQLHGLWLEADKPLASLTTDKMRKVSLQTQPGISGSAKLGNTAEGDRPILLYLHGARWNVTGSAFRMRRMQELGFSVLGVDYRGFGKSSTELPSEAMAYEDARAAWDWLAAKYPDRPRYIFGHSLGGPIAIHLAAQVSDESGTIVEGTFTSIADVVSTFKWGWMPVSALITQRFEAIRKVDQIGSPLLVVHGGRDQLIDPTLGRKLYEAATGPKLFVLVQDGSHHNTNSVGQPQYRAALAQLFKLDAR